MKKFLKTAFSISVKSVIIVLVMSMLFSAGYVVRPFTVDRLPDEVAKYIGEKEVKTLDAREFQGTRMLLGVFDGKLEQINPNGLRTLMRADLQWVVDVELIRSGSPAITTIVTEVPIDGKTLVISLRLRGVESYKITTVKNEVREVIKEVEKPTSGLDEDSF